MLLQRHLNKQVTGRKVDNLRDKFFIHGCKLDKKKSDLILEYTSLNIGNLTNPHWTQDKIPADDPYATHTAMLRLRLHPTSEISVTAELKNGNKLALSKEVGTTGEIGRYALLDFEKDRKGGGEILVSLRIHSST